MENINTLHKFYEHFTVPLQLLNSYFDTCCNTGNFKKIIYIEPSRTYLQPLSQLRNNFALKPMLICHMTFTLKIKKIEADKRKV